MKVIVQNMKSKTVDKESANLSNYCPGKDLIPCEVEYWCSPRYCDNAHCNPRLDPG